MSCARLHMSTAAMYLLLLLSKSFFIVIACNIYMTIITLTYLAHFLSWKEEEYKCKDAEVTANVLARATRVREILDEQASAKRRLTGALGGSSSESAAESSSGDVIEQEPVYMSNIQTVLKGF
ncbi:hypothetical protein J3Q64DRAFT_1863222 [Phycomyces blakesleeanus]|uniref:Uncharacterized protein n=1 Tax=Phycomyces blakesleeanus TaxID=4837 RepID=A0ABR3AXL4_PHYBL